MATWVPMYAMLHAGLPLMMLRALWLALPVLGAGLFHMWIIKSGALPWLARLPLDAGLRLGGHRIFGDNKTVRGAVVMMIATMLIAWMLSLTPAAVQQRLASAPFQLAHPAIWGLLLGAGYIIGELPNSMVKRQLGIAPGAAASGWRAALFWVADQLDSAVGMFLLLRTVWKPDAQFVAVVLALALLVHPMAAALMVSMGLKRRIG